VISFRLMTSLALLLAMSASTQTRPTQHERAAARLRWLHPCSSVSSRPTFDLAKIHTSDTVVGRPSPSYSSYFSLNQAMKETPKKREVHIRLTLDVIAMLHTLAEKMKKLKHRVWDLKNLYVSIFLSHRCL